MKTLIYRMLFALLFCIPLLFLTAIPVAAASHADAPITPNFTKIDAYVNAQIQEARISGLAFTLWDG